MELDFQTVKALSSPTRIQILSAVMEKERTPTDLSRDIGKSKSTVSSHLSRLEEAGLVDRDEEEGRRRVTYSPSRKAEAIVKGKERRVRFSLASSALTGTVGIALLWSQITEPLSASKQTEAAMMAADAGTTAAESGPLASDLLVFGLGALALVAAGTALFYALVLQRLG